MCKILGYFGILATKLVSNEPLQTLKLTMLSILSLSGEEEYLSM